MGYHSHLRCHLDECPNNLKTRPSCRFCTCVIGDREKFHYQKTNERDLHKLYSAIGGIIGIRREL